MELVLEDLGNYRKPPKDYSNPYSMIGVSPPNRNKRCDICGGAIEMYQGCKLRCKSCGLTTD